MEREKYFPEESVRRHMTLVAPKEKNFAPVQARCKMGDQLLVQAARRRSAGERYGELPVILDSART
jgi:hypothetical protein